MGLISQISQMGLIRNNQPRIMNCKALFFDIDGTLVSFNTHSIPQSTVDALTEAKRRGVGIYISTGRPKRLINNLGAIEHLIDGYITTNGALCVVGDEVVSCLPIPAGEARALVEKSDEMKFAMMLIGERDLTVCNPTPDVDRIYRGMLGVGYLGEDVSREEVLSQRIIQMTPIIDEATERQLMPLLPGCVSARWYYEFTDITALGADKGSALYTMAARLGLDIGETMAFGDGGNDKTIIREAGVGVAMGNAGEDVKALADYVTSSVDEGGVAAALSRFGII